MPLYNNPVLPGVNISVNDAATSVLPDVGAFNNIYYFTHYSGQTPTGLKVGKVNPIPNLETYKSMFVGGAPSNQDDFRDYLSVAALFANKAANAIVNIIPVTPPPNFYQLFADGTFAENSTYRYQFYINGIEVKGQVIIPTGLASATERANYVLDKVADQFRTIPAVRNLIYVDGPAYNWTLDLLPVNPNVPITLTLIPYEQYADQSPYPTTTGERLTPGANEWVLSQSDWTLTEMEPRHYITAVYSALTEKSPLGVILTPRIYWSFLTGLYLSDAPNFGTKAVLREIDRFCALTDHLYVGDVPDLDVSAAANALYGTPVTVSAIYDYGRVYDGDLYKELQPVTYPAAYTPGTTSIPYGEYRLLPSEVTINGIKSALVQCVNTGGAVFPTNFADPTIPVKFKAVPRGSWLQLQINLGKLAIEEYSSNKEQNLYNYRETFTSLKGNTSIAAPYQLFSGPELEGNLFDFWIPASVYSASLWTRVANDVSPRTPPASNLYPLYRTAGGPFEVTDGGHAILNGRGINIIKTYNNVQYMMGARTASVEDVHIWQNARLILSMLVRALRTVMERGIVLQATDSSGAFLNGVKDRLTLICNLFADQGLIEDPNVICDASINPPAQLSSGLIKAQVYYTQINTGEKIVVTITPTVAGAITQVAGTTVNSASLISGG